MCDKPVYIVRFGNRNPEEFDTFTEAGNHLESEGYQMAEATNYGVKNYLEVPHKNRGRNYAKMRKRCLD